MTRTVAIELAAGRTYESSISSVYLGTLSFDEARAIQERHLVRVIKGAEADCLFFCEHPPTLSLGLRTLAKDILVAKEDILARGIEIVRASRGGSVTYHGPGQLVIYPVIWLRRRGLGVRKFVSLGLGVLQEVIQEFGVCCRMDLANPGVWTFSRVGNPRGRKLAAVGLHIVHGVTNHGFSLNLSGDLSPFRLFSPCGMPGAEASSISTELGDGSDLLVSSKAVSDLITEKIANKLLNKQ